MGEEATVCIRQIIRRAASGAGVEDDTSPCVRQVARKPMSDMRTGERQQEELMDPSIKWIQEAAEEDVEYQEQEYQERKS